MNTRFPIDDLRTLVAKALQGGRYSPAESKRIRAVPDTRTIRYYTTLGLIDRPAEMRGRTAMYEARHVMQLVAIKRLQAANQTLSDVQSRLVGIQTKQLTKLADLPDGFWESAERFLASKQKRAPKTVDSNGMEPDGGELRTDGEARAFWDEPAALPSSLPQSDESHEHSTTFIPWTQSSSRSSDPWLRRCLTWEPLPGVRILLDSASDGGPIDQTRLQEAALPLLQELLRQGLLKDTSLPPEATP